MFRELASLGLVFLGAGLGGVARHVAVRLVPPQAGFPLGVLAVNIAGCFLMGALVARLGRYGAEAANLRLFLGVGVLGGFTTFSAFSAEALGLWEAGRGGAAGLYVASSIVLTLAAAGAGAGLVRLLQG